MGNLIEFAHIQLLSLIVIEGMRLERERISMFKKVKKFSDKYVTNLVFRSESCMNAIGCDGTNGISFIVEVRFCISKIVLRQGICLLRAKWMKCKCLVVTIRPLDLVKFNCKGGGMLNDEENHHPSASLLSFDVTIIAFKVSVSPLVVRSSLPILCRLFSGIIEGAKFIYLGGIEIEMARNWNYLFLSNLINIISLRILASTEGMIP